MGKKKTKTPDVPPKEEFDAVELISKRPQTVVLVLQSDEETVLQKVCEALYKFADKSPENKLQLLNFGALDYLIKLIGHENKLVRRNAVMCIGTVASEATARRLMRKLGCVVPLLTLLSPEEEMVCHEFGSLALSWLAEEYTSKVEIFENQGLPLLINHLMSPDCDVQHNSARAIGLLLEDFQCRAAFKELNGVEPLLKLLDSDYPAIQRLSLTALIICSQDPENRSAIRELNGLAKLVDIIGAESMSDLHLPCLKCLANCLEDIDSLKQIQSSGVFQKLLAFVAESSNPEMQQFTATVISVACRIDENRQIFSEQDTEKTLITLLSSDNVLVVTAAAKGLAAISENLTSRDKIGKLDGIPPIVQLLKNENEEARQTASLALANFTKNNPSNCAIVMEKNTIDILIDLLSDANFETQSNTAICLSNLSMNETLRTEIIQHGVIKGLTCAIKSEDTNVQIHGCQALASYLYDQQSRAQLLEEEDAINQLVSLIQSNNEQVRRNASWVIVLCAVDQAVAEEVTRCGGLMVLQNINLSSRRSKFTVTAFERLLNSNLPAKYALMGKLDFDNKINDVFYDTGRIAPGETFPSLNKLQNRPIDQSRPILLINFNTHSVRMKPTHQQDQAEKMIKEKSREDTSQSEPASKEFVESVDKQSKSRLTRYKLPVDKTFISYVKETRLTIKRSLSAEEQAQELACYVCDKMGGPIGKVDITNFFYEHHISELKTEFDSNIIPIGKIEHGIYYHRALLFKVLADKISLPCSLVRGDYGRAWNEVQIFDVDENGEIIFPPKIFVVDLMHNPGQLMTSGSPEAVSYQRI
ncbi:armadillo repeat-containing protein 3-like isoform X2 [Hydractinia symbiolongicarpus]|uniref:armadillo repeat-containing protein 3-like isoform X2 n=1 Tax=Hydractinia symbiolongicarpus TaxID=13093 RepID=UPI00254BB3F8|nr:armadillo repeat-containing protein 3-like isoform X2 [Hydractinia symbiolongicarpus]